MRSKTEYISAVFLGCVASYSENDDKAIRFLEQAFEQSDSTLIGIKASPITAFIRTNARFQPFLVRMNFPQ